MRLGVWTPEVQDPAPAEPEPERTLHEFASEWLARHSAEWREPTRIDYTWRLSAHLLPFFAEFPLSRIGVEDVDRYREAKVRERDELQRAREENAKLPEDERRRLARPLSNGSINKTIRLLATILTEAEEYGLIDRNPARGRKRLLREARPPRSFANPRQVLALLDAAADLDATAREGDTGRRRPLLAVLVLGGLRIGEALNLRWRDIALGGQRLRVVESKTDAGVREVALSPLLLEAQTEYRARARFTGPDDYVFATGGAGHESESNARNRILAPAVERANTALLAEGAQTMEAITPHSLRRTFISLLLFAGVDLRRVMAEVGHADPKMTLGLYAQVMTMDEDFSGVLGDLVGRGYENEDVADGAPSPQRV